MACLDDVIWSCRRNFVLTTGLEIALKQIEIDDLMIAEMNGGNEYGDLRN